MGRPAREPGSALRRRVTLRALTILRTLLAGPASAAQLIAAAEAELGAEAFGGRPVFALRHDLQALRAAGFAVEFDRARRVYRGGQGQLGSLSLDHARALGMLVRSVNDTLPFSTRLGEVLAALAGTLPPDLRHEVARPGLRIELHAEPPLRPFEPTLETLAHALAARRRLQITYRSASRGVETRRVVEPLDLVLRHRHVYLVAFDVSVGQQRQFRLDRIVDLVVLPSLAQPRRVTRAAIRLRFRASPRLARHVPSAFETTEVTPLPDGSAIVTAETSSLFWATRTLLAYGEHVEVLEPPGLRRELQRIARALYERYNGESRRVAEQREDYQGS